MLSEASPFRIVETGKIHSINDYAAAAGAGQASQQIKQRRLAGSGRPYDGHELARLYIEGNTAQCLHFNPPGGVHLGQIFDGDDW